MTDDITDDIFLNQLSTGAQRLLRMDGPRYRRLWGYYRNPMKVLAADVADSAGTQRPYRQAQEWGLPSRITGYRSSTELNEGVAVDGTTRKEVVIENDIAWRIDTMVDSLFGKPLVVSSAAVDPRRRAMLSELLRLILAQNGGIAFLQQVALLGSIYGFVDILVKLDTAALEDVAPITTEPSHCGTADLGRPPTCDNGDEDPRSIVELTADVPPSAHATSDDARVGDCTTTDTSRAAHVPSLPVTGLASTDDPSANTNPEAARAVSADVLSRIARLVRLEIVEPTRALPVFAANDVRTIEAYAQVYTAIRTPQRAPRAYKTRWIDRMKRSAAGLIGARDPLAMPVATDDEHATVVELLTPTVWKRFEDGKLIASGVNSLGTIPLVHVQNVAEPFAYEGAGDVQPLIPLQDELNIRLSDRANRITLQSFKMYLGKGIENFTETPIAPGQMWATDNVDADVVQFGGDTGSPTEDAHIAEVREALDKTSGVTPIAAGAIKGRIGRLTSAAALRITLQALLNRTEKKRTTYGAAIERMCELSLTWLDVAGVLKTLPNERRVELSWSSPIPQNETEQLEQAQAKLRVGVPQAIVLRELGY